jgi:hypothetical protein
VEPAAELQQLSLIKHVVPPSGTQTAELEEEKAEDVVELASELVNEVIEELDESLLMAELVDDADDSLLNTLDEVLSTEDKLLVDEAAEELEDLSLLLADQELDRTVDYRMN